MKPIVPTVETGPNYVFHLMAAARIGFDSDYAGRYGDTVVPGDLALLRENSQRLSFGAGRGGDLVETLIFLPAYLGLDSPGELAEFFRVLCADVGAGEPAGQLRRYGRRLAGMLDWVSGDDFSARYRWLGGSLDLIRQLGDVYVRNFPAYLKHVWSAEEPPMLEVAEQIAGSVGRRDLIGDWERLTGREFRADRYEIVLCSAIRNGPNANSLGYDRNVFFSGSDPAFLTEFISHETGTHILIDLMKSGFWREAGYPFGLAYEGYENLSKFYNAFILGRRPATYKVSRADDRWQEVFARVHAAGRGATPEQLFAAGLAEMAPPGEVAPPAGATTSP